MERDPSELAQSLSLEERLRMFNGELRLQMDRSLGRHREWERLSYEEIIGCVQGAIDSLELKKNEYGQDISLLLPELFESQNKKTLSPRQKNTKVIVDSYLKHLDNEALKQAVWEASVEIFPMGLNVKARELPGYEVVSGISRLPFEEQILIARMLMEEFGLDKSSKYGPDLITLYKRQNALTKGYDFATRRVLDALVARSEDLPNPAI